ncbi:MAG: SDR family oxidoreductase [Legionella sp.]|nr:SDR family oxidoreductase [Legionella sp.]
MKVLILGGSGMLGHQLLTGLQKQHEVRVTLRETIRTYQSYGIFDETNSYYGIDLIQKEALDDVIVDFKPDAIVNAAGVIKQRQPTNEITEHLEMNALFPHRLANLCKKFNIRLIHISTDCVFSGLKGQYTENDLSDAEDIYGKTKFLGEVLCDNVINLRTSFIGPELSRKTSLLEWYLAQTGKIKGYNRVFFSGLTTLEISRVIHHLLTAHRSLSGIWNVSGQPISKYHLLLRLTQLLRRQDIFIEAYADLACDRSLNSQAFQETTLYMPPSWDRMLIELTDQIRNNPLYASSKCMH